MNSMTDDLSDSEKALQDFIDQIHLGVRSEGLDAATARVARMTGRPDVAEAAKQRMLERANEFGLLKDPPVIEPPGIKRWYGGPQSSDLYWPVVKTYIASKWRNHDAIEELDRASTRIIASFGNPHSGDFSLRGLVAGDVQSGKTTNFTAVIAKAADAGYGLFIVLSGTKNKLRKQTQERINIDLVERNLTQWFWLTTDSGDFSQEGKSNAAQVLARARQQPVIMVVKKNRSRLVRLADWLKGAPVAMRRATPTLVVDDEADEASINTAKANSRRAAVNGGILRVLELLPKVTFVGYTATPYANFLIDAGDESDLYPRDFIATLKSGNDYFGYEKIFGRERTRFDQSDEDIDGLDMIRLVSREEAEQVRAIGSVGGAGVSIGAMQSLQNAINWFVLATAARLVRGHLQEHSSMLIHTSQRIATHRLFEGPIEDWCSELLLSIVAGDRAVRARMRELWATECEAVSPSFFDRKGDDFEKVWASLPEVLKRLKVIVENSMTPAEERLIYGPEPGIFVVIGGDVLSRGLTLEGLVCSYFTRSASAFDTLMQMGRWFGYRRGFEDLPRIWMTAELSSNFYEMGSIDREMRQLIGRMYSDSITPREFAPMMRKHPRLAITSRMKMQGPIIKREYSYGDRRVQTILFNHKDAAWLNANLQSTQSLLDQSMASGIKPRNSSIHNRLVFDGVPADLVLQFLGKYRFHDQSVDMNRSALVEYIAAERQAGALDEWSIVVVEGPDKTGGTTRIGAGLEVTNVKRSRIEGDTAYANIKSLMSQDDAVADSDIDPRGIETFDELISLRNKYKPGIGLLVIYPIDNKSEPAMRRSARTRSARVALDAVSPVVGLGMVFPRSVSGRDRATYIQLELPPTVVEEPDEDEEVE